MKPNNPKKYEGIEVCDLKISIFEMKKHYEVQFVFKNRDNIDNRMDTAINYLGTEGFFKEKKRIKATAVQISGTDGTNNLATSEDPNE